VNRRWGAGQRQERRHGGCWRRGRLAL